MRLKILNQPTRTRPGTINYRFRDLLAALNLLDSRERTWLLSGAIVTWPEELLDEHLEVHDPRVRFSRDGHDFACTQEVLVQIANGIEGDWTDVYATSVPFDKVTIDHVASPTDMPCEFHFECVDAAYWVVETNELDIARRLDVCGFATVASPSPRPPTKSISSSDGIWRVSSGWNFW